MFIDIGQSSLNVHAIACVFTYIMHYCLIIISQVLLNTENYCTYNNLLTHVDYPVLTFILCKQTYMKALLLHSTITMFLSHDEHPRMFPFVSGIALYDCCLLLVTSYYRIHIYSDYNLFINVSWFGESIVITRSINMLYQMMLVKLFILLPLIACSRITFSKSSYNLKSILDSFIIKMVIFFLAYNLLFILYPVCYAIYDIDSRFITILCVDVSLDCTRSCVIFLVVDHGQYATCNIRLLFVLITILVFYIVICIICSVLHIHLNSPCTYTHQLVCKIVLYIVTCELLFNDNLPFLRVTKLILSMLAGDIELNPGPRYVSPQGTHSLQVCHLNIQSLRRNHEKHKHIGLQLAGKYDIITLSETWLAPDIPNDVYDITGYHPLFRRDRQTNTIGGGVAAWISMDLVGKRRLDLEVHSVEAMWLEVRNCNHTLLICTVYHPHTESITFWESMQFMLDNARHTGISNILFAGDLNADKLSRSGDVKRNGEMFDFFVSVNHLSSHINEPTRITPQTFQNLLNHSNQKKVVVVIISAQFY